MEHVKTFIPHSNSRCFAPLRSSDRSQMEKIAALFDVNDTEIKESHEALLHKMSARLQPEKEKIQTVVKEEYLVLKEEAKKQKELDKKLDVIASVKEAQGEQVRSRVATGY